MLFKSKAPEKDKNAAANADEVTGGMVQQQHSVVEQVAATPLVPKAETASCIGSGMEVERLNSRKSGAPGKERSGAAMRPRALGGRGRRMSRGGGGQSRRQKRERPLASAPTCRSSATSNAKVQRRSSAESKARCARRTGRGQHHCAERDSLRPRQGHYPCRPRQAAERWCGRG